MKYRIKFSQQGKKELKKLDAFTQKIIMKWICKNLIDTENLRIHGKELKGNLKCFWRYRVGNYRLLADIQDETVTILSIKIGHRKEIYE
ncbi:hypothetical protein IX329_002142 [Fusobacterium necrophorum]|uniref:type II toxin-antitoxin system RelE family toxin n=1 Tax=Fusobacterium necrophorum TaxID=859 RepID=UPI00046189BB|nr:type II toxin-antitoxin system RelE/ParE family toxin [Fusobacterium necrophorum]KDE66417.1 pirin [Fusobacterium necrophorum BFTR-1]MBR8734531.1 hypothetical protein [Fusobacterium necrophorum]MBR8790688.1 hypothetical protein [Fusobacterium necrophorum]